MTSTATRDRERFATTTRRAVGGSAVGGGLVALRDALADEIAAAFRDALGAQARLASWAPGGAPVSVHELDLAGDRCRSACDHIARATRAATELAQLQAATGDLNDASGPSGPAATRTYPPSGCDREPLGGDHPGEPGRSYRCWSCKRFVTNPRARCEHCGFEPDLGWA